MDTAALLVGIGSGLIALSSLGVAILALKKSGKLASKREDFERQLRADDSLGRIVDALTTIRTDWNPQSANRSDVRRVRQDSMRRLRRELHLPFGCVQYVGKFVETEDIIDEIENQMLRDENSEGDGDEVYQLLERLTQMANPTGKVLPY